jgi:hypothetical protein
MNQNLSRKQFLSLAAFSTATVVMANPARLNFSADTKGDPLPAALVQEWVTVAHSNFERVQTLYTQEPRLLNVSWDWGGGDFETALEAAGHVGNRDIATFLLEKGARMNMFCAAMLGQLDLVKSTLDAFPGLKTSGGPHGLKLKHHAAKGGEQAKAVLDYLESIGAA